MFEENKLKEEHLLENKINYIKILESKINERFEEETSKREDLECKIFSIINSKFNSLLNEIINESKDRVCCVENLKLYLDANQRDNPDLNESLSNEKRKRIDNDNELSFRISNEISHIQNAINEQKKIRENSEQAILDTLKTTIDKTKSDLNNEKKRRKCAEENILSLIEDTLYKINQLDEIDHCDM